MCNGENGQMHKTNENSSGSIIYYYLLYTCLISTILYKAHKLIILSFGITIRIIDKFKLNNFSQRCMAFATDQ